VIHCAGLETKDTLDNIDIQSYEPKVLGAYFLHQFAPQDVELFWLCSSISSVWGIGSQYGYCYANAYMDSLALARKQSGLAVTVRSIGPVKDVGMAAKVEEEMLSIGLLSVPVEVVVDAFETDDVVSIVCGMKPTFGAHMLKQSSLFEGLLVDLKLLKNNEDVSSKFQTKEEITEEMSRIVEAITSEEIDLHAPLMEAGLDSLSAVELRNSMQQSFCMKVSGTVLFDHPTIAEIVEMILSKVGTKEYTRTYDIVGEENNKVLVDNLIISREGYGKVEYMGMVELDKENFPNNLEDVVITENEVMLVGDSEYEDPGKGLNGTCIVTFSNFFGNDETKPEHETLQANFMEENILLLEFSNSRVRIYRENIQ